MKKNPRDQLKYSGVWNRRSPLNKRSPGPKKFNITILIHLYINQGIAVIFHFFFLQILSLFIKLSFQDIWRAHQIVSRILYLRKYFTNFSWFFKGLQSVFFIDKINIYIGSLFLFWSQSKTSTLQVRKQRKFCGKKLIDL